MVLCEDLECGVCFQRYSRSERVPRMLFCHHTFCTTCLEKIAVERSSMMNIRCPMCRQVSCVRGGLSLQEALWVNSRLWDGISEDQDQEEEELSSVAAAAQTECGLRPSPKPHRPKLHLPAFLKKLSFPRQPQESIVPGCNVQMKSWRRLLGDETC
ncbi:RING finger protein 224-like [Astyanax mexicanus]|uniref:RING finger protein 224-like n=1 Tax=Astyanax mexicanus TaxID=7994 RepID=A0A8T2MA39_ASTMX|nr:RING finger protein 224-like [Astyanax mexicanus]